MTSPPIKNKFIALTDDEILYEYYSYDWLQYMANEDSMKHIRKADKKEIHYLIKNAVYLSFV